MDATLGRALAQIQFGTQNLKKSGMDRAHLPVPEF
jgi:hypothetical protein